MPTVRQANPGSPTSAPREGSPRWGTIERSPPAAPPTDRGGGMTPHRPGWDVFNPYGAKERCDPQLSEVLSPARSRHTRVRGIRSRPLFRVLQQYDGEVVTELPVYIASNGIEDTIECNVGLRSR